MKSESELILGVLYVRLANVLRECSRHGPLGGGGDELRERSRVTQEGHP